MDFEVSLKRKRDERTGLNRTTTGARFNSINLFDRHNEELDALEHIEEPITPRLTTRTLTHSPPPSVAKAKRNYTRYVVRGNNRGFNSNLRNRILFPTSPSTDSESPLEGINPLLLLRQQSLFPTSTKPSSSLGGGPATPIHRIEEIAGTNTAVAQNMLDQVMQFTQRMEARPTANGNTSTAITIEDDDDANNYVEDLFDFNPIDDSPIVDITTTTTATTTTTTNTTATATANTTATASSSSLDLKESQPESSSIMKYFEIIEAYEEYFGGSTREILAMQNSSATKIQKLDRTIQGMQRTLKSLNDLVILLQDTVIQQGGNRLRRGRRGHEDEEDEEGDD